jgi:DNA modification methylase
MTKEEVGKPEEERILKSPLQKAHLEWGDMNKNVECASLPFQTIETINESKADRENNRLLRIGGRPTTSWRNKLIWGDNKYVMASLLDEFAGKIDLIYIDPPFDTGEDYYYAVNVGGESLTKAPSMIEELAWRDFWKRSPDSYLQMMYERLELMKKLLSERGSIYVHMDWHLAHYLKVILDEIFGYENFITEIIWNYGTASGGRAAGNKPIKSHDTILVYARSYGKHVYNKLHLPYSEKYVRERFVFKDKDGRIYRTRKRGDIVTRQYLDESPGVPLSTVWNDIMQLYGMHLVKRKKEEVGFPTQKPEALLERIIKMASNEDDLVADFFCGSGTTLVVAEKLKRRWIGCDMGRFAIHSTRKRLLGIPGCRPFEIMNLGKYERQYWQTTMVSGKSIEQRLDEYYAFILKLYRAEPITGFQHLHGRKGSRLVHVGAVDAPVTLSEIEETISECLRVKQDKLDILGWEFEMGIDVEIKKWAEARQIDLQLKRIPREVMDKRLADLQGKSPVSFFDLGVLNVEPDPNKGPAKIKVGEPLKIEVTYFNIPHLDLLEEEEARKKIKKWEDLIDYWSIDWDYKEDTFHNQWQDFRTRTEPKIRLKASSNESEPRPYQKQGNYKALVKVIDIFGNDTTRMLEVHVR